MSNEENIEKTLVDELTEALEEGLAEVAEEAASSEDEAKAESVEKEAEVETEAIQAEDTEAESAKDVEPETENAEPEDAEAENAEAESTEAESTEAESTETEDAVAESAEAVNEETEEAETESVEGTDAEVKETSEETEEPQEKAKKKINKKIVAIVAAAVLAVLLIGYFATSIYYSDRFLMKTAVNGTDCAGMTIEEVEELIQKQVEEYVLTIHTIDGTDEQISGTDIGIKYIGYNQLKEAFEEQNSYLWPKALFVSKDINVEVVFDYDQEKLDAAIAGLNCMKEENQVAPVSATVVYKDGAFVIQEETLGAQLDVEKLTELINSSVFAINTDIDLKKSGCYVEPRFSKNSSEVTAARDEMNRYLGTVIQYSLDSIKTELNRDTFASWIYVDEDMNPGISVDKAKDFARALSNMYNTPDHDGVITTPTGKQVGMAGAVLGRAVGIDAEGEQIVKDIREGKKVSRAPVIARQAMAEGQFVWGNTYLEVDITEQHMWYIVNGQIALETDVVTGWKNRMDTPTGIYNILEMKRNKTLRGPGYATPVSFWMRVTWSGIGFHDATWQAAFGGNRYAIGYGSHGCINMPWNKASELYNMLNVGCPVVIHN